MQRYLAQGMDAQAQEATQQIEETKRAITLHKQKYRDLVKQKQAMGRERDDYFTAIKENQLLKSKLKQKRNSSQVPVTLQTPSASHVSLSKAITARKSS